MDDFVVALSDYQYNTCQDVDIYNAHTQRHIQARVAFIPSMGDENTYILTNIMDVKYDLFEVACIVRHLDTPKLSHNSEMSFKNMNDFMFRVTMDDSNLSKDLTLIPALKKQVQQRELQQRELQQPQQPQQPPNQYIKALHEYVQHQAQAHQAYAHHVQYQAYAHQAYANHIQQQTPQQPQQSNVRETPSQELSHYQSKKNARKMMNTPNIKVGRRQKFRKLFEEAIHEEPQLHIERTINDDCEYNYGMVHLAIDIPSFKTADGEYNENY
jgi:hypothetical protein